MEKPPQKSWKMNGCRGRFYVRGKSNVIWYEVYDRPRSLRLIYNRRNRGIAADLVRAEELKAIRPDPDAPYLFTDAYENFYNASLFRKSASTKAIYATAISNMLDECMLHDVKGIQKLIENSISRLVDNKSPHTINTYLNCLQCVFNFFIQKKWIDENPVLKQYFFKIPNKPIEIFSKDELNKLFNFWQARDEVFYLFLKFLYKTAFRISEGLHLRYWQISDGSEWRREIILKKSKYGNISESFPLAPVIAEIFERLNIIREPDSLVFKIVNRKSNGQADRTAICRRFTNSFSRLGIARSNFDLPGKRRSIHTLRKTRITEWITEDKLDVMTIQRLSRDNIQTVMRYYAQLNSGDYHSLIK